MLSSLICWKDIHLQPKPTYHTHIAITLAEDVRHKLHTEYYTSKIFCGPASTIRDCKISGEVQPWGKVKGSKDSCKMTATAPSMGPYFVSFIDGRLMPAYRIYEDTYETFIQVRPRLGVNRRAYFNPNSPPDFNSMEVKHPKMRLTSI